MSTPPIVSASTSTSRGFSGPRIAAEAAHGGAERVAALDGHPDAAAGPERAAPGLGAGGGEDLAVGGLVVLAHAATPGSCEATISA